MPITTYSGLNMPLLREPNWEKEAQEKDERAQKLEKGKHDIDLAKHNTKAQEMANAIYEKWKEQEMEDTHALRKAQTKQALQAGRPHKFEGLNDLQKNLAAIYDEGSPEYKRALMEHLGIEAPGNAQSLGPEVQGSQSMYPKGTPLSGLPKNEAVAHMKRMDSELQLAQGMTRAYKIANDVKKVLDENPGLASSLSLRNYLSGEKENGISKGLKRIFTSEKELAAAEKIQKMMSELVLLKGEKLGKQFSDSRARMIENTKANAMNTDEANQYIVESLLDEFRPGPAYEKALRKSLDSRRYIHSDPELFSEITRQMEEEKNEMGETQPGDPPLEHLQQTAKKRGIPVEEVLRLYREKMGVRQ